MKANTYGIIPAEVRYNKNLNSLAKLLYAEITACAGYDGTCQYDMEYFGKVLDCHARTVYRYLAQLVECGCVKREGDTIIINNGFVNRADRKESDNVSGYEQEDVKFFNDFLTRFEEGLDTIISRKELYYDTLSERLKTFSKHELVTALDNRLAFVKDDEWHQKPENRRFITDITLLIRDTQSIHKWLNIQVDKPVKLTAFKYE